MPARRGRPHPTSIRQLLRQPGAESGSTDPGPGKGRCSLRLKLIGCEVLRRELSAVVARSPHQVDTELLPQGSHERPASELLASFQQAVDATDPDRYDAVLLGYGLCGGQVAGLVARQIPVVLTRAHDCIGLFLGVPDRCLDYAHRRPGVCFTSTGWVKRVIGEEEAGLGPVPVDQADRHAPSRAELVAKYGEDNAEFLQTEGERYITRYTQLTFIETGAQPEGRFERCTVEEAARRGWRFAEEPGEESLLQGLVAGDWDPRRYLIVEPGQRIVRRPENGSLGTQAIAG